MYGKIEKISSNSIRITGEDGNTYTPTSESERNINLKEAEYVLFNPIPSSIDDARNLANIISPIYPKHADKKYLLSCVQKWSQEATQDKGEFIPIDAYEEIIDTNKCIVIGRKGIGKTAIAKKIRDSNQGNAAIYSFENFPFEKIYEIKSESFSQTHYKQIWVVLYLTLALTVLKNNHKSASNSKSISRKISGTAEKLLNDPRTVLIGEVLNAVATINGFSIINPITALTAINKIISSRKKDGSHSNDQSLFEIQEALISAITSIEDRPVIHIIFDQLDEEYKEQNSCHYANLIESLFAATIFISSPERPDGSKIDLGIKPLVLLRDDIFETQFSTNNKAKYKSYVATPKWNKDNLKSVILSRLKQASNRHDVVTFEQIWLDLFNAFFVYNTRTKELFSSYECFMRHTSWTPRDVVELLKESLIALAKSNDRLQCDEKLFREARLSYSEYYYAQSIDGMKTKIPNIQDIWATINSKLKSNTISLEKFIEFVAPHIPMGLPEEQKSIENLANALSTANSEEARSLIQSLLQEKIRLKKNNEENNAKAILNEMWNVCAIGLLKNQQVFTAKYLDNSDFIIKDNEQICFHPAIGVHLKMNIPVNGITASINNDRSFDRGKTDQFGKFPLSLLDSEQGRKLAQEELSGQVWLLKATKNDSWLGNIEFPGNIYCPKDKIPKELNSTTTTEVEAEISIQEYNGKWQYRVKQFLGGEPAPYEPAPYFTLEKIRNEKSRAQVDAELKKQEFSMRLVRILIDGNFVLYHAKFEHNIVCPKELMHYQVAPKLDDYMSVKAKIVFSKKNQDWRYGVQRAQSQC